MNKRNILFCDLKKQYHFIESEVNNAISKVLSSGNFILGKEVEGLEKEFAHYCNCSFGVGVGSGTEALHLALLVGGIKSGDEVITVANAGVPTIVAIMQTGATPVFVDIDPKSYTIDVSKIENRITNRTRTIIPIHLYGQCADTETL